MYKVSRDGFIKQGKTRIYYFKTFISLEAIITMKMLRFLNYLFILCIKSFQRYKKRQRNKLCIFHFRDLQNFYVLLDLRKF